jgi:hypothetical protein
MTAAPAIRSATFPSLVLSAMLVALTPNTSRAEGQIASPFAPLAHEAHDNAGRYEPATYPDSPTTGSGQTVRSETETSGDTTLAENAWDFTNPDSIPGFASTPYPVLSNPEIAD